MEDFQDELTIDKLKNNLNSSMQNITNVNHKTYGNSSDLGTFSDKNAFIENGLTDHQLEYVNMKEEIIQDINNDKAAVSANVILELSDATGNLSESDNISQVSVDFLRDGEEEKPIVTTNVDIDSYQEVLLETDNKSKSSKSFAFADLEKTSQQNIHVSSQNECLQPTDLDQNMINDSKQKNVIANNLTIFDGDMKKSQSESNMDQSEIFPITVICSATFAKDNEKIKPEVVSELKDSNSLIKKDAVLNGGNIGSRGNDTVTQESLPVMKSLDNYRCESDSWSEDDDDSSSSSDTSSDSDFFQMVVESSGPKNLPEIKTRGELGLDDLPPIEDLTITVSQEEMMLVGKIHAVVDKLVVVHALKDMQPLDLESVLFLSHDKPLGRVYDVFGPVVQPFYCVRFNTVDHLHEKSVEIGFDIFFAPSKEHITSYVFVDELQKEKGSDASWKYNNEPPEECLDFSDDEQEKAAKRKRMNKNRNRQISASSDVSAKRPFVRSDSDSQQNLNYRSAAWPTSTPRSNNKVFSTPRFNPFKNPYPPPSPSPSVSNVFAAPRFTPFSSPYSPHPSPCPSPSVSSVFAAPRFTPFSSSYSPHPPPLPSPVSSVFTAPRFTPFSSPYPPPSPLPSVSSVFAAPIYTPSPYSCPPSPTLSVSSVFSVPGFMPIPNSRPPSPSPSICSVMSVPVRARTQLNFSNQKQFRTPFSQHSRSFSPQDAIPRLTTSNLQHHTLMTSSAQGVLQQPASPIMLQSLPQSAMQRPAILPQSAQQRPAYPPQNIIQRQIFPPQNIIQRPIFPPQNIQQRPALPPALPPYQQTHVFGQFTQSSPLPPPPNMPILLPPPATPTNCFSPVNLQEFPRGPPPHSPNAPSYSHIPHHHPLTVEIPNVNNSSVPVNHFLPPRNDTVWPALNNININGQPPLY